MKCKVHQLIKCKITLMLEWPDTRGSSATIWPLPWLAHVAVHGCKLLQLVQLVCSFQACLCSIWPAVDGVYVLQAQASVSRPGAAAVSNNLHSGVSPVTISRSL